MCVVVRFSAHTEIFKGGWEMLKLFLYGKSAIHGAAAVETELAVWILFGAFALNRPFPPMFP